LDKQAILPEGKAPDPLGTYNHAVRVGDFLYIAGQGCRSADTGREDGVVLDDLGRVVSYDIATQTRGVLRNLSTVLATAGLDLSHVIDVTVFLCDMGDFDAYNAVWAEYFCNDQSNDSVLPTRTTVAVKQLPGRNFIEMKAIAAYTSLKS
jgi:2-aminomuconate deaminase